MSITYTGVNGGSFVNIIIGPSPGDLVTAGSIGVVAQGAANLSKRLFDIKADLAGATFTGEVRQPRLNVSVQSVGVIAANTQVTNTVGLVIVQCAAADATNYNLALPTVVTGNPVIVLKFYGGAGVGPRRVWITNTANLAVSTPADYYAIWDPTVASDQRAGALAAWDGSRWRIIVSTGLTTPEGGGTLAE